MCAMFFFAPPRPSKYRTLDKQIAMDWVRFSRTESASISASPSPNGGGAHFLAESAFSCFASSFAVAAVGFRVPKSVSTS